MPRRLSTIYENNNQYTNIPNMLHNIISTNVQSASPSSRKTKYFKKGIAIATKELKKKFKLPFKIALLSDSKKNKDLELPVIKYFRQSVNMYKHQLVVYYNNGKSNNLQAFYDSMYGKGKFDKHLQEIYQNIVSQIKSSLLNKSNHGKKSKVYLLEDDRYTFCYWVDQYIHVELRKVDKEMNNSAQNRKFHLVPSVTLPIHKIEDLYDMMEKRFTSKLIKNDSDGLPLSILLLSEKTVKGQSNLHIDFGYTFKDSRGKGYSTILRKLVQLYAYDNDIDLVSTNAVTFGSQRGSKSAGMFQMPQANVNWKKLASMSLTEKQQENMFLPRNNSKLESGLAKLYKTVYNKTKYTPRRHKNAIKKVMGGNILKVRSIKGNYNKIYGTHMRKVKNRENIPIGMITRDGKSSLYF